MDDFLGCALVVERELGGGIPYKAGKQIEINNKLVYSSFSVKSRVRCWGVVFFEWHFLYIFFGCRHMRMKTPQVSYSSPSGTNTFANHQWIFQVPVKGGR